MSEYHGTEVYGRRKRSRWPLRAPAVFVLAMVCTAAGYGIATFSAAQWRSEYEHARMVLLNPRSTDTQLRDAWFVIGRNEKETAAAAKSSAARAHGTLAKHAQNILAYIREDWK